MRVGLCFVLCALCLVEGAVAQQLPPAFSVVAGARVAPSITPVEPASPTDGWWNFESGAVYADDSGNGYTLTGSLFDGADDGSDYVCDTYFAAAERTAQRSGFSSIFDSSVETVSFWVNPYTTQSANGIIIGAGNWGTSGLTVYWIEASDRIGVYYHTASGADGALSEIGTVPNDGSWTHVMFIKRSSSCDIYINGEFNSTTTGLSYLTSATWLRFGASSSSSQKLKMKFDDCRFWDYELTAANAIWLYQNRQHGTP